MKYPFHVFSLWVWVFCSAAALGEEKPIPLLTVRTAEEKSDRRDAQWMEFSPDGKHLVVRMSLPATKLRSEGVVRDNVVQVYDATTGECVAKAHIPDGSEIDSTVLKPRCISSPKGDWVAYQQKGVLQFLVMPPHIPTLPKKVNLHDVEPLYGRLWSDADGTGVFGMSGSDQSYSLHWLDLQKLDTQGTPKDKLLFKVREDDRNITAVSLNPNCRRFAVATESGVNERPRIELWSLTDKPVKTILPLRVRARSLAIFPDGKTLIAGCGDGSVVWYETTTGKDIKQISLPAGSTVSSLAVHPGGKYLACGTTDRGTPNVYLIDVTTGEAVTKLLAEVNGVTHVCFDQRGHRLAVYGTTTVTIWDATKLLKLERD
jgi:WD40 repeat protein